MPKYQIPLGLTPLKLDKYSKGKNNPSCGGPASSISSSALSLKHISSNPSPSASPAASNTLVPSGAIRRILNAPTFSCSPHIHTTASGKSSLIISSTSSTSIANSCSSSGMSSPPSLSKTCAFNGVVLKRMERHTSNNRE